MSSVSSVTNNPLASLSTSGISFSGLASGLNTNQIVQALTAEQQAQITELQTSQTAITNKENAYQTLQTNLTALQTAASSLSTSFNNTLSGKTVSSSNSSVVSGSATTNAVNGQYSFTVNTLAQAEAVASQGYASATSAIGTGNLQLQVGTGATTTINITNTNNTLQGLANAINSSGANVTASIVNDGTASPYRILLTSNQTGLDNTINITNNLTGSGGTQPLLTTNVQSAQDASITLGGAGGLTVTNDTNTIQNAINGVTLNLQGTSPSQAVTVSVTNNTQGAVTAVQNFVDAYNTLNDSLNSLNSYNAQTQQAGVLLGDSTAIGLQSQVADAVGGVVAGVNGQANSLAAVGVTVGANGDLTLNSSTLTSALNGQVSGVSPNDVLNLFALNGTSSNNSISFAGTSNATNINTLQNTPVQVNITQAASQATVAANNNPFSGGGSVNIATGTNDTLQLSVNNGATATLTLAAGNYSSSSALLGAVQTAIQASALSGQVVAGVNSNGQLTFSTQNYGSSQSISITGGTALGSVGYSSPASANGSDVEGNFIVNGQSYIASGSGQLLTGAKGPTQGLSVLSAATGATSGTLTVTNGIAAQVGQLANNFLNPATGLFASLNSSLQTQFSDLGTQITQQQAQLAQQQKSLLTQFANMETTVAKLQSISSFLSASSSSSSSSNPLSSTFSNSSSS